MGANRSLKAVPFSTPSAGCGRSAQEIGGIDTQRNGKALDDRDCRIARAAFNVADIGAVDPGFVCEPFLAQPLVLAKLPHVPTEALANIHADRKKRM